MGAIDVATVILIDAEALVDSTDFFALIIWRQGLLTPGIYDVMELLAYDPDTALGPLVSLTAHGHVQLKAHRQGHPPQLATICGR